jgi:hypothetical protein
MLNLLTVMFKFLLILPLLFFAQTAEPSILSPKAGETLRGQVEISGNLNVANFSSAELAFSYASDPDSWFTIQTFSQIPETQNLATWDTALLTDGDYILHLRVLFQDGSAQDIVISGLKIRNDEIPATDTPTPTEEESSPRPITATPAPTIDSVAITPVFPTPKPLPPNPATVTSISIFSYLARGGLLALVLFIFFALILRLRKN